MRDASRRAGALLTVAMLSVGSGCGGGGQLNMADTSKTEAKVTGTVKVRGKAMNGGEITFDPANLGRKDVGPKTAKVNEKGGFEVTTLVGRNAVRISGPAVKKDPALGYGTHSVDVKSGDNPVDLDFPPN